MKPTEILCKARFKGRMRPLKLKSTVRPTTKQAKSTPCLNEMTAVMQCWKANDFQDFKCGSEIRAFLSCSEKAMQIGAPSPDTSTTADKSWWPHEVVNASLKKLSSKR